MASEAVRYVIYSKNIHVYMPEHILILASFPGPAHILASYPGPTHILASYPGPTHILASFPGPTQLSVACSMEKHAGRT